MINSHWKDYPELTRNYRTEEEDKLSDKIVILLKAFGKYLKNNKSPKECFYDLQGSIHLLQNILITIQKRRFNNEKEN